MEGDDPGQGTTVHHEFNIVLTDDPAHSVQPDASPDLLKLLSGFYETVTRRVFPGVFTAMSQPLPPG